MPTPATAATLAASFFIPNKPPNISSLPLIGASRIPITRMTWRKSARSIRIPCRVAVSTDVSSSSSSSLLSDEEIEAESKVGKRIKVKMPLKVCHVTKAPDLDLNGMEGVIKQYVGLWKGKRISANLPFKVEFFVEVEGQANPVKFFAHLKEDEFDLLEDV